MNELPVSTPPANVSHQGRRRSRRTLGLLTALVLALGAALVPSTGVTVAAAADDPNTITKTPLGDFDPGNLISDEVFFTGSALSAGQVQTFLKGKVAQCAATDGPACLKDFRMSTKSVAANAYCKAYAGATNERASRIIAKVGKACGVSPKVLLVLLQKEQSLVTSIAPTQRQYDFATGFACPDDGGCNPENAGFFNQVYGGARQFKRYLLAEDVYKWRPAGQVHEIQYHPNKACGTQTVLLKNKATAGLYYYTPYVPNAAALANLNGRGDLDNGGEKCSSFGNRNFWRGFTEWFGSTDIAVTGTVQKAWLSRGGLEGAFGKQRNAQVCSADGRYCVQTFQGGTLASSKKSGIALPKGAARTAWVKQRSHKGALGWPTSTYRCRTSDGTCLQRFTGGYVASTATTGARVVSGAAAKVWRSAGTRNGALKMPRANAKCTKAGARCTQKFQGGVVTVHPTYGSRAVTGAIASRWTKGKGTKGALGWPIKNQKCSKVKGGKACYQLFSKGVMTTHPSHGTRQVTGKFGTTWVKAQKSHRSLGHATSNRKCTKKKGVKTCTQKFTKGKITQKGKAAAKFVRYKR